MSLSAVGQMSPDPVSYTHLSAEKARGGLNELFFDIADGKPRLSAGIAARQRHNTAEYVALAYDRHGAAYIISTAVLHRRIFFVALTPDIQAAPLDYFFKLLGEMCIRDRNKMCLISVRVRLYKSRRL